MEDEPAESVSGNKDWDIIIREGHPTYYGSVEVSHQIWDDVEKGKVIFADSFDEYGDTTILTMDAYRKSDLIREVEVYLKNFEQPMEISLEEILPTVATYVPVMSLKSKLEHKLQRAVVDKVTEKVMPGGAEGAVNSVVTKLGKLTGQSTAPEYIKKAEK